jgi:thymidylate synthase (FAD)
MNDHGATLIWITPDAEALIARMARVSSQNPNNPEYVRLFQYLIKHRHWSPFEMASACFYVHTTRAISAQIIRHRSFSFQEFSQRYAPVAERPAFPEIRLAGATNRQSSIPVEIADLTPKQLKAVENAENALLDSYDAYKQLLDAGVAHETARMYLPLSTMTRLYMAGTIRSWMHYVLLRTAPDTQEEHRQVALAIRQQLSHYLPNIFDNLEELNAIVDKQQVRGSG